MALALIAGLALLGTVPITFALLLMLPAHGDSSFELLANLFNEGGSWAYAVALAGGIASMAAAFFMALSVRKPSVPAPLALVPFLLVWLAALGGTALSMSSMREAVMHASPADRAIILLAGTGEVASLRLFAFAWSAAGALCLVVASLLAMAGPGRAARVLTVLAAGALGLSLGAAMLQGFELREGLLAGARANPADRATLLAASVDGYLRFGRLSNGLLLFALAVAGVGAAVLSARGKQQAALSIAASLIVCAVGFRGLAAVCERQLVSGAHDPAPATPAPLAFEGLFPRDDRWEILESGEPAEIDRKISNRVEYRGLDDSHPTLSVQIPPTMTPAALLRVLQVARHLKFERVELVGAAIRKLDVPPAFEPAAALMSVVPQATQVQVTFDEDDCECAGSAKWTAAGLEVTGLDGKVQTWPSAKPDAIASVIDVQRLDFDGTTPLEPMDLVHASLTALSRGHLLVVKVAPPKDPPEVP